MIAAPIHLAASRLLSFMEMERTLPLGKFDVNDAMRNARVGKLRRFIDEFRTELDKVGRDIARLPAREAMIDHAGEQAFSFSKLILNLAEREAIRLEFRAYGGEDEKQFQSIDFKFLYEGLDHELLACGTGPAGAADLIKPVGKVTAFDDIPRTSVSEQREWFWMNFSQELARAKVVCKTDRGRKRLNILKSAVMGLYSALYELHSIRTQPNVQADELNSAATRLLLQFKNFDRLITADDLERLAAVHAQGSAASLAGMNRSSYGMLCRDLALRHVQILKAHRSGPTPLTPDGKFSQIAHLDDVQDTRCFYLRHDPATGKFIADCSPKDIEAVNAAFSAIPDLNFAGTVALYPESNRELPKQSGRQGEIATAGEPTGNKPEQRRRGRVKGETKHDPIKDLQIANEWDRCKSDITQKDFAKEKNVSQKDLKRLLDRVYKRRIHSPN
ncbi:MAG: hypothetical protein JWP89_4853 [Schlesneria sp.]|nr:hypothetical protein [Schlesneria sp.]